MTEKEIKISALKDGTVIDHIPPHCVFDVVDMLKVDEHPDTVSVSTNLESKQMGKKGIVKVAGKELTKKEVDEIALIAPEATINIIKNYEVVDKSDVAVPDELTNIMHCSNPNCITNKQKMGTAFNVISKDPLKVRCKYCERVMQTGQFKLR